MYKLPPITPNPDRLLITVIHLSSRNAEDALIPKAMLMLML